MMIAVMAVVSLEHHDDRNHVMIAVMAAVSVKTS
jgi:hypothetical protein